MKKIALTAVSILTLLFISCDKNKDEPQKPAVELKSEVNDFVWRAMNHWYFWQSDVTSLNDNKPDDIDAYYTYLNSYSDSKKLFESLKNNSLDDFSWYIEDVDEQLNSFRGISVSYGIDLPRTVVKIFQNSEDIVIYVQYVVSGSPADQAGIKRGDLIYKVNGTVLNTGNFTELNKIFTETSVTLGVAKFENGELVPKGEDHALTAIQVNENPVHFSKIIEEDGKKIGYLVYNSFVSTYHSELNDVFATFKSANIDELILDLRYNGGGSVLTSAYLSSMIDGNQADGSSFASLAFNDKRNEENGSTYPFYDAAALFNKETGKFENNFVAINRLKNLSRLYVITTGQTASASEMIINGIRPFMDVITVGTKTVGKNEGSNTLVDAPKNDDNQVYTNINGRKTSHTVGLQPITFQIFNSLKQNDYGDGFAPTVEIDEVEYATNILPFGDSNEALLRAALDNIKNAVARPEITKAKWQVYKYGNLKKQKFSEEMYIIPEEELLKK